jgi:tetratricopeptide (TPR) repeat protein
LTLTRDPRVAPVLAAHLTDDTRLVRVSAAEGLTGLGITKLDGPAGDALAHAQDEWAASLATFNDSADDHTALGWLQAARGRVEEGMRELHTAIALDAADPRPHVYLGILAARAGRFDEALQQFKIAKTLGPAYRNLDRLVEEAQKRAAPR